MITKITLVPSRIGCPSIPGTMKGIIMSVKGVQEVSVHYEERSVDVMFDDKETSIDQVIKAVGDEMGLAVRAKDDKGKEDGSVAETCPM